MKDGAQLRRCIGRFQSEVVKGLLHGTMTARSFVAFHMEACFWLCKSSIVTLLTSEGQCPTPLEPFLRMYAD